MLFLDCPVYSTSFVYRSLVRLMLYGVFLRYGKNIRPDNSMLRGPGEDHPLEKKTIFISTRNK